MTSKLYSNVFARYEHGLISYIKYRLFVARTGGNLHADGTYKLMWQGFPVLVVGSSDKNKKFRPMGLAVASSETTEDYMFMFNTLKQSCGQNYHPAVLIADCADTIMNASVQIFGHNLVRVHCWAHVIRNIDKKLVLVPENERAEVRADILSLQLSKSQAEFDAAKVLWTKKWTVREGVDAFFNYFTTEYLNKYDG